MTRNKAGGQEPQHRLGQLSLGASKVQGSAMTGIDGLPTGTNSVVFRLEY